MKEDFSQLEALIQQITTITENDSITEKIEFVLSSSDSIMDLYQVLFNESKKYLKYLSWEIEKPEYEKKYSGFSVFLSLGQKSLWKVEFCPYVFLFHMWYHICAHYLSKQYYLKGEFRFAPGQSLICKVWHLWNDLISNLTTCVVPMFQRTFTSFFVVP